MRKIAQKAEIAFENFTRFASGNTQVTVEGSLLGTSTTARNAG